MSITINDNINRAVPLQDVKTPSVIKNADARPSTLSKVTFENVIQQKPDVAKKEVVTNEEKQFFENMFPDASSSIRSYSVYAQNGLKKQIQLGTIIDARG